jgi:hypothetical protein
MIGGMSSEEFQNYLGLLSRLLRLRAKERESIEEELRSHLEERLAALTAEGIEPARAVSMALAEFGDAAALAAEFTAVSRYYKRRWIMRLTVGSIAASIIMAAVLVSYWPAGPVNLTQNSALAQQGEKVKETPAPDPELDANAQTRAKLNKLIGAEFAEQPLSIVLDYVADKINVQFHMDMKALSQSGVTSDTPITFNLKNVPAEMVLRLILRDIGDHTSGDCTYYLDNGVIIVTTTDEADTRSETQVYRIDDLIYSSPITKGKETSDIFAKKPNKVKYDSLIDLIKSTVHTNCWDDVGGVGSICPYRGTLVISQTADVHQEIQKLLKDLRLSINQDIEDDITPQSRRGGGGMGGMNGAIGGVESSNKEPEKKDSGQPPSEKGKKSPKDSREGMGQF